MSELFDKPQTAPAAKQPDREPRTGRSASTKPAARALSKTTESQPAGLPAMLEKSLPRMLKMLPSQFDTPAKRERFAQILLSLARNPKIAQCTALSVMAGMFQCGRLGLYPDPVLQYIHFVPFYNSKIGKKEATIIVGYKGLIELARRSGVVIKAVSVVYANDLFEYRLTNLEQKLDHTPWWATGCDERAPAEAEYQGIKGAYCIAKLPSGDVLPHAMPIADILKRRPNRGTEIIDAPRTPKNASLPEPQPNRGTEIIATPRNQKPVFSPVRRRKREAESIEALWNPKNAFFPEMCMKTVLRSASRLWPQNPDMGRAFDIEGHQERGETIDVYPDPGMKELLNDTRKMLEEEHRQNVEQFQNGFAGDDSGDSGESETNDSNKKENEQ